MRGVGRWSWRCGRGRGLRAAERAAPWAALGALLSACRLPCGSAFRTPFGSCVTTAFHRLLVASIEVFQMDSNAAQSAVRELVASPDFEPGGVLEGCHVAAVLREILEANVIGGSSMNVTLQWLRSVWWSELLVVHWASLLLELALRAVGLVRKRGGLADPDSEAAASGGSAETLLTATAAQEAFIAALRAGNASVASLGGFVSHLDRAQRLWLLAKRPLQTLPWWLSSLSHELVERPLPRVWWAGSGDMWISIHCGDAFSCIQHCVPLLQEATQTLLLSRHRLFLVAAEAECREPLESWLEGVPLHATLLDEPNLAEAGKSVGYELAVLFAHRRLLERALAERAAGLPSPTAVVGFDIAGARLDGDSAVAHVWDLERWLLHGGAQGTVNPRRWDVLFPFDDGPARYAAAGERPIDAVAQCNQLGQIVPRTSVLILRVAEKSVDFMKLVCNAAIGLRKLQPGSEHMGIEVGAFAGLASEAVAAVLADGDASRLSATSALRRASRCRGALTFAGGAALCRGRGGCAEWGGELGWRGIRVLGVGTSAWQEAADPEALLMRCRGPGCRVRDEDLPPPRCEGFSTGSSSKIAKLPSGTWTFQMANCVAYPALDLGAGIMTPGSLRRDLWFCPRRAPVAVHALLRVGSHSIVNWAAEVDGLSAWISSTFNLTGGSLRTNVLWTPWELMPQCCARGVGRLLLAVLRSPFDRLRSYYLRRESPSRGALAFPDWCRWVLGRVRAEDPGAAGLAATSSKSSKEVWTESDALHLMPLARSLRSARPPLDLAALAPLFPTAAVAAGGRLLLITRVERMAEDMSVADGILRARFGFHGPLLPDFPHSHVTLGKASAKSFDRNTCCPWTDDVVHDVMDVYSDEIGLGGYSKLSAGGTLPRSEPVLLHGPDALT